MVGQRGHNVRRRHYPTRKIGKRGNSHSITLPKELQQTDFPYDQETELEPVLVEEEGEQSRLELVPVEADD
jgi:hypothetical protein